LPKNELLLKGYTTLAMTVETINNKVQFLFDRKDKRTHAVLPIYEYEGLIEDLYDNAVADSREDEGTISLEELKKRLREDG